METVAVIPARGGSKRIPRKNIRLFCGKPMISYSILAAQESGLFDRIFVSSEDEEIISISKEWGSEIIQRPKELSDDFTPTIPVIRHAIDWMENKNISPTAVCCIYATSPLVRPSDIIDGYQALMNGNWDYVFSATEFVYPMQRSFRIKEDGSVEMFFPEKFEKRTQDLEAAYHDADKFYWGRKRAWMESDVMFNERSTAIKIPNYRVQVIDTEEDWIRAEMILRMTQADKEE